ncbi:hypothetical protein L596_028144 [Steinernema carpocapsae]|uniref:Nematode cuticle collagen N-terminal domain-containing protein n=1 Tax=Steinernema carpocapsae TaxID=34508 RepID=A0A4U5LXJ8_STECR|nr:hypothetical protein L596_028144 [Steinernema carpocapsae]
MSSVLAAAWVPLALGALAGVVSVCVVIDNITDVWNEIDCEMEDFNKEYEEIWKDMERLTTARRDAVARRRRYYQPISGILGQDLRVVQSLTVDIGIPIPYPRSEGSCACELLRFKLPTICIVCVTSPRKCLPGERAERYQGSSRTQRRRRNRWNSGNRCPRSRESRGERGR